MAIVMAKEKDLNKACWCVCQLLRRHQTVHRDDGLTKYCTELQWEKGKEHIPSVNRDLLYMLEQKDHKSSSQLFLLLPSLQPNNTPNSFFFRGQKEYMTEWTESETKNCTRFPKLWLCRFSGAIFLLEIAYFSWTTKHVMTTTMLL